MTSAIAKTLTTTPYVHYHGHMKIEQAIKAFAALSQETRLKVFKILVEYGPTGTPAGVISDRLCIPHNTLSFHLNHMSEAGLVASKRLGRSIIYRANLAFVQQLIRFMVENCCTADFANLQTDKKRGCDVIELARCCPPKKKGTKS